MLKSRRLSGVALPLTCILVTLCHVDALSYGRQSLCHVDALSNGRQSMYKQICKVTGSNTESRLSCDDLSRRKCLSNAVAALTLPTLVIQGDPALAAPPMTAGEADNVGARVERSLRKKPPKLLRNQVNLDFAVLLMRSSYNSLDELDCVAMDQFQRDFFLIRQAEYQPYVDSLGPGVVKQGDLTDPYYFDFISFAQYATINREMMDPPVVFEEQQPVDVGEGEPQKFVPKVIKRSIDTDMLPIRHSDMVGEKVLGRLNEIFGGTDIAIPAIRRDAGSGKLNSDSVLKALQQLTKLFVINGFAFEGDVAMSKQKDFSITLNNPATLWSGQALQMRKAKVTNSFLLKTACALLIGAGCVVSNENVKYSANQEITTFTVG